MPWLDPTPLLPYSDQETSRDAAVKAQRFGAMQRARYLSWMTSKGVSGATDAEAEIGIPMRRSSICARRAECVHDGTVVPTERRRGGCRVWRAV